MNNRPSPPVGFLKMIVEQGWLEYGLILILAFVVIVIVTLAMGGQIQEVFYNLMRRLGAQ